MQQVDGNLWDLFLWRILANVANEFIIVAVGVCVFRLLKVLYMYYQ